MQRLLSIADISRRTNIAESTVRYYRDKFPNHFHGTGEGKRKKYYHDSVEKILTISQCMSKNMTIAETEQELNARYNAVVETVQESTTTPHKEIFSILTALSDAMNRSNVVMQEQAESIKSYENKIDELIREVRELKSKKWYQVWK